VGHPHHVVRPLSGFLVEEALAKRQLFEVYPASTSLFVLNRIKIERHRLGSSEKIKMEDVDDFCDGVMVFNTEAGGIKHTTC
jgi:hypothetical protein